MYIKRDLEKKLKQYLDKPEILAVIGPRQSGKTTLLREFAKPLKKAVYVDFEDRDVLELFNNDIKSFYARYAQDAAFLFIDEFQYAKEGGQRLKYLYDAHKTKIIISGSSVLDLTHQAVKYLVGRIFIFSLFPLSFEEFLRYRDAALCDNIYLPLKKKMKNYSVPGNESIPRISDEIIKELLKHYYDYSIYGGYPRVVTAHSRDEKIMVLKNIYNTYFLREIRDILQLSTEDALQKLIKALALQIGSTIAYNELGQVASLNYAALLKHLNILEKTYVIKRVQPFCRNKRVEISKMPKAYFVDNGFRNMVIANFQDFNKRPDAGSLNENFVASQLLKAEQNFNFWRTKSNAEIDFVLEEQGGITVIEVKSSLRSNVAGKALYSFKEKYAPGKMIIASENYFAYDRNLGVLFLPLMFI